jgi:1,2-diacylglycerol 3-alpha-glucosyltransferase
MKAALVINHIGPYHHARLLAASARRPVTVIETGEVGNVAYEVGFAPLGYRLVRLGEPGRVPASLWKALDGEKPDVLVIMGWSARYALATLAWGAKHGARCVVITESQREDRARGPLTEALKRSLVRGFAVGFCAGSRHAEYLVDLGMARERIVFGCDVVDNDYFAEKAEEIRKRKTEIRKHFGLPENYFFASARFIEKKNLPRLLQAYARYRELASRAESGKQQAEIWDLVLLGDGPLRETLNSQLSTLNLEPFVHLPGFKRYAELPAYYGLARAFVHASTVEQWGLVVNEAMASGLPVLVSNCCGCAPELVQEGVNGFTFDPLNVEQLAGLMLKVSAFNFPLSAFGSASQEIIRRWSPALFAESFWAAVDTAAKAGPPKLGLLARIALPLLLRR